MLNHLFLQCPACRMPFFVDRDSQFLDGHRFCCPDCGNWTLIDNAARSAERLRLVERVPSQVPQPCELCGRRRTARYPVRTRSGLRRLACLECWRYAIAKVTPDEA